MYKWPKTTTIVLISIYSEHPYLAALTLVPFQPDLLNVTINNGLVACEWETPPEERLLAASWYM
jgi:hypothetical protein